MDHRALASKLDNFFLGGGLIFIYSGSAQLISFKINCFYSVLTRIYEYQPPSQFSSLLQPCIKKKFLPAKPDNNR